MSCAVHTSPSGRPLGEEGYDAPDPNPETLKTILQFHGCPEHMVGLVANGYAPREFYFGLKPFWKVRDAFYRLAALSVHCFMGNASRLSLHQIVSMIVEKIDPQDPFIHELNYAVNEVTWDQYVCSEGVFFWPLSIPPVSGTYCPWQQDLWTAIRLFVLYNIRCVNPVLLPVDFSSWLYSFTDTELVHVQSLIADKITALPPPKPPMPQSIMPPKPSVFPSSVPQEPSATAPNLDAELKRLLDALQNGPKSATELELALNVKRGVLRKRYLLPAEEKGLVEKTAPGSSSKQRYRLIPAACQVSPVAVTGATAPVMGDLKNTEQQVEQPENIVSEIITVSRARRSARKKGPRDDSRRACARRPPPPRGRRLHR